jgi:hypothetical protein
LMLPMAGEMLKDATGRLLMGSVPAGGTSATWMDR